MATHCAVEIDGLADPQSDPNVLTHRLPLPAPSSKVRHSYCLACKAAPQRAGAQMSAN